MSSSDTNRRAEQAAEPTGAFVAAHNTESGGPQAAGQPDPLLSLLRAPAAAGELGRLAHFAVTRLLGRGGMGAVFVADDLLLNRKVALKMMRPELTARPGARERFLREAQTAGGLEHDHVVTVLQVGEDNGVPFIAMPLLKGEALDDRLEREGRLSVAAALKLGRETAEGLAAAHAQSLVHRDVKPANIWLESRPGEPGDSSPRFRAKILDFGLARAVQDDQRLSAEGGLLGTPSYMPPEQARGEEVDGRADLFALGAVLYRCLAGEPPFGGPNTMAVLSALANKKPVPVRERNPDAPPALADLIMRLLSKAPDARPQTAEEVAEALRRIEQDHAAATVQVRPAPLGRRLSPQTVCLLVLLGLAVVAAGVIAVKVQTPGSKETAATGLTGTQVNVGAKDDGPAPPAHSDAADLPVKAGDSGVAAPVVTAKDDGSAPPDDAANFSLKAGNSDVHALVVTADGMRVVAGYEDGFLRVWDWKERKLLTEYHAGHPIRSLALHPDDRTVAVSCAGGPCSLGTLLIELKCGVSPALTAAPRASRSIAAATCCSRRTAGTSRSSYRT